MSPALAGGFLTTVPPGKPCDLVFCFLFLLVCLFLFWIFRAVYLQTIKYSLFSLVKQMAYIKHIRFRSYKTLLKILAKKHTFTTN